FHTSRALKPYSFPFSSLRRTYWKSHAGRGKRGGGGIRLQSGKILVVSGQPVEGKSIARGGLSMKRVAFVCVENSNRSQVAETFARIHGAGTVEAFSAGSRPSGRVNPEAVAAMKELRCDLTTHRSKGLDRFEGQESDAVTMACGDQGPLVLVDK